MVAAAASAGGLQVGLDSPNDITGIEDVDAEGFGVAPKACGRFGIVTV